MTDRLFKIAAWGYVLALVAATYAHLNLHAEIGMAFDIYRIVALCVAGMLARLAYPQAASGVCLMMIAAVFGLGLAHYMSSGDFGSPIDAILEMAASLWGIVIGAGANRIRLSIVGR